MQPAVARNFSTESTHNTADIQAPTAVGNHGPMSEFRKHTINELADMNYGYEEAGLHLVDHKGSCLTEFFAVCKLISAFRGKVTSHWALQAMAATSASSYKQPRGRRSFDSLTFLLTPKNVTEPTDCFEY